MIGREVTYEGRRAVVLSERIFPMHGLSLAIQFLDRNGRTLTLKNRPKGFQQYIYVDAKKVFQEKFPKRVNDA